MGYPPSSVTVPEWSELDLSRLREGPYPSLLGVLGERSWPGFAPVLGAMMPLGQWLRSDDDRVIHSFSSMSGAPQASSERVERVEWFQTFGVVDIVPTAANEWRTWELTRVSVGDATLLAIEQIVTSVDRIRALDAGLVIFEWAPQNGATPTISTVEHPAPTGGSLEWTWSVQACAFNERQDQPARVLDGSPVQGDHIVLPWANQSQGSDLTLGTRLQQEVQENSLVRLFVHVRVTELNRFTLRAGGRLSGYTQIGGPQHRARRTATRRN